MKSKLEKLALFLFVIIPLSSFSQEEVEQVEEPAGIKMNERERQLDAIVSSNEFSDPEILSHSARVREAQREIDRVNENLDIAMFSSSSRTQEMVTRTQGGRGVETIKLKEIDLLINGSNSEIDFAINPNYQRSAIHVVSLSNNWEIETDEYRWLKSSHKPIRKTFEDVPDYDLSIPKSVLILPDEYVLSIGDYQPSNNESYLRVVVHEANGNLSLPVVRDNRLHPGLFKWKSDEYEYEYNVFRAAKYHPILDTVVGVVNVKRDSYEEDSKIWLFSFDYRVGAFVWGSTFFPPDYWSSVNAADIEVLNDGSVIIIGTVHNGLVEKEVLVSKINIDGSIEWVRVCGGMGDDVAMSIDKIDDGGLVVLANTTSKNDQYTNLMYPWIIRLNGEGDVLWEQKVDIGRSENLKVAFDGANAVVAIDMAKDKSMNLYFDVSTSFQKFNWDHDNSYIKEKFPFIQTDSDPLAEPSLTCLNPYFEPESLNFKITEAARDRRLH